MSQTPVTTVAKRSTHDAKGRFTTGNAGRPKGTRNIQGLLDEAIQQAQSLRAELQEPCSCVMEQWLLATPETRQVIYARSCKTLDQHFARRAFLNDTVLAAFQKKRIADLTPSKDDAVPPDRPSPKFIFHLSTGQKKEAGLAELMSGR